MRSRPRRLAAVVSCTLLLGACTGGTAPDDDPTTLPSDDGASALPSSTASAAASPTSSASPKTADSSPTADRSSTADPFAIPDEITSTYLQRVIDEINRIDAEITVGILETDVDPDALELPNRFVERTADIYADPLLGINLRLKSALYRLEDERDDLYPPEQWGMRRVDVEEILDRRPGCILFRGLTDLSQIDAEPSAPEIEFFFLTPDEASNATGWLLARIIGDQSEPRTPDAELRDVAADDLTALYPETCG